MSEVDWGQQIAQLRLQGAHRFEPVRFHFLEVLAQRTLSAQGGLRRVLDAKLAAALAQWCARRDAAQGAAPPNAARQKPPEPTPLNALAHYLAQPAGQAMQNATDSTLEGPAAARRELKSVQNFRSTWSRLSADRQVSQALKQPPRNAGPINSHMLVLRSLAMMRDISPDYLNHFMSYVDTLLCLEQNDKAQPPMAKADAAGASGKKAKVRRPR